LRSRHRPPSYPRVRGIQCAAAARINLRQLWNTGSPAFAGTTAVQSTPSRSRRADSREFCREILTLLKQRARGSRALGAPAASYAMKNKTYELVTTVTPERPGIPRAMVYGCFVLFPVTGLVCHRRPRRLSCELDSSVGESERHDLAVRFRRSRLEHPPRPPHPAPRC
jgi:hypothetical protein